MDELMFKSKTVTPKLNMYVITVTGKYNDDLPYETKIIDVDEVRMNNFVLLFLAYVGNRNWQHTWENSTFGKDLKKRTCTDISWCIYRRYSLSVYGTYVE